MTIHTSTDHLNIHLCVRKINYTLLTYADLGFLISEDWKEGNPVPPKFLIFFDDIQDFINTMNFLRNRLPPHLRDKIKWFNSDMMTEFKETKVKALTAGDTWGLCTMESFRMVSYWRKEVAPSTYYDIREWIYQIFALSSNGAHRIHCQ